MRWFRKYLHLGQYSDSDTMQIVEIVPRKYAKKYFANIIIIWVAITIMIDDNASQHLMKHGGDPVS